MLKKVKWDTLAKVAKWLKENASVLVDTHWVGGDSTALAMYDWPSWNKDKAILGLRNPSDKPQTYYLELAKDFEIPTGYAAQVSLKAVYGINKTLPVEDKNATVITLQALETLVFEAIPVN